MALFMNEIRNYWSDLDTISRTKTVVDVYNCCKEPFQFFASEFQIYLELLKIKSPQTYMTRTYYTIG